MEDLGDITVNLIELEESKELLMEMSSIRKKIYNLPVNIWLDDIGSERNVKHNFPRIKVQSNYSDRLDSKNLISLSIEKNPIILAGDLGELKDKDLNKIKKFVSKNYDVLLDYWYGRLDLREVLNSLRS